MRKIILCVLAVMLWSQAVDALICYNCPNGGNCLNTVTCSDNQDRCITIFFLGPVQAPLQDLDYRASKMLNNGIADAVPDSLLILLDIRIAFKRAGSLPPRFAKRCSSQYECQLLNSVPGTGIRAICCGFDKCNR